VHVWAYPYSAIGAVDCPARDLMRVDADRLLLTAIQHARERCASAIEYVLMEGSPSLCLPTSVRPGDLLVLGARGRGRMRSGVLGSTVNRVLDEVVVPVAVLPAGRAPR
jgi:nucleotide-binding universal stress UspA family protein